VTEPLLIDLVRFTARVSGSLLFLVLAASGVPWLGAAGAWLVAVLLRLSSCPAAAEPPRPAELA